MAEDPHGTSTTGRWLRRLTQGRSSEPRDREQIIEELREASERGVIDADALSMIEGVLEVADTQVRDIMSQRMQSFVLDAADNPFNVVEPGKHPRATLTPTLALKDGKPFLSFAVQGGDTQDQNLLQFFLNIVEFGMTVQEATEAANITSYQMRDSFGDHESIPGRLTLNDSIAPWVRDELRRMGYKPEFEERTSGPINAIFFDRAHGTLWGGSSNHGEDYGIAW